MQTLVARSSSPSPPPEERVGERRPLQSYEVTVHGNGWREGDRDPRKFL
jgi:hypothetical protein